MFFMVIDTTSRWPEKAKVRNVFLELVDSRDLLDIVDEDVIEPEIVYVTPEPTAVPTQVPATTEPVKQSGGSMLGIVIVLLVAAGGALWYFKVYKPKQGDKGKSGEKDYEFDDDDDDDEEETVNEDE